MKLYLAGNPGHGKAGLYREQYLRKIKAQLVMSYYWVQEGGDFHKYFRRMINGPKISTLRKSTNKSN